MGCFCVSLCVSVKQHWKLIKVNKQINWLHTLYKSPWRILYTHSDVEQILQMWFSDEHLTICPQLWRVRQVGGDTVHKFRHHACDVVVGLTDVTRSDAWRQRPKRVIRRNQTETGLTGSDGSRGKEGGGSRWAGGVGCGGGRGSTGAATVNSYGEER